MTEPFDTFSPPRAKPIPWDAPPETTSEDHAALDPRAAAALLEQTTRDAERQFEEQPPHVLFAAAVTVLLAYGAAWFSVRHQHPYSGPTSTGLAVLYGVLAVWIVFVATVMRRRLHGRSSPRRRLEALVFTPIWICVYIFEGALYHVDHDHAVAYGVWAAVAPLLVVGAAAAGYLAGRGRRAAAALAAAAVALAAIGAFAGPRNVWAVMGVGLCALLLVGSAGRYWQRRMRTA